jgi:hypothetical protein
MLAPEPSSDPHGSGFRNEVPSVSDPAVVWLERGASAVRTEIRHARRGLPSDDDKETAVAVMIGIDPHKGSHTASAIDENEVLLDPLRVRAAAGQVDGLLRWAAQFEQRMWAVEGAGGIGYLLAQQLVSAGERVVDVQPKLAARVRLLATESTNKNDPNDAR